MDRHKTGLKKRNTLNNKLQDAMALANQPHVDDDSDEDESDCSSVGGVHMQVQKLNSVKDGHGANALGGALKKFEDAPSPPLSPVIAKHAAPGQKRASVGARMSVMMDFGRKKGAENLAKMDATQRAMIVMGIVMVCWCIVSTAILGAFSDRYLRVQTTVEREWYVINGCMTWAKVRASRILGAALRAAEAVDVAVQFGIWANPTDYNAVEQVLAPIFYESPELYEVELALSDRPFTMVIRRNVLNPQELTMRSDSADCYLLGVDGCVALGASSGARPSWYSDILYGPRNSSWASRPEIMRRQAYSKDDDRLYDIITPTYSFNFRTDFPGFSNPPVRLLGHVTLEIGSLSGNALRDERLGEDGGVFVSDGAGWLLSARDPADWVKLTDRDDGQAELGFRKIWSLSEPWAEPLRSGFSSGAAQEMRQLHSDSGAFVAVSPLDGPLLEHFAVAAVAPYRMPFTDEGLLWTSIIAALIAFIPYFLFVSSFCYLTTKHVGAQMKSTRTTAIFSGSMRNFKSLASRVSSKTTRSPSRWFKAVKMRMSTARYTQTTTDVQACG